MKNIDLLSRYFDGEMDTAEKEEFYERLKKDPELVQDYRIYLMVETDLKAMSDEIEILAQPDYTEAEKIAMETMNSYEPESAEATMVKSYLKNRKASTVHPASIKGSGRSRSRRLISYSAIAASIVSAFFLLKMMLTRPDPDKIFAEYYTTPVMVTDLTRNDNASINEKLNTAVALISAGEYTEAESIINEIMITGQKRPQVLFLSSIVLMETDRYREALDFLELEAIKGSEYELESIWYQALLYLKMEEIEKADERLSKLSEMPSKYQEDASDLLRELRRIK